MLTNINALIFEQIPGCIGWKNISLKYEGANKNLLTIMKVKYVEQVLGLSDHELAFNSNKLNQVFEEQDFLALKGHSSEIIHDRGLPNENKNSLLQKNPLYKDNKIVGVIYHCTQLLHVEEFMPSLKSLDQSLKTTANSANYYYVGAENHNPAALSNRELECLFLQLRGKTAKQMAMVLGLSKRTIEDYLDNIKSKLGCHNKAEVLVTAIALKYQHYIPKSLLNRDFSKILAL
ncbi:MAG TPA: LuxR C-terminal-related transcriptional regulator [Gammaproteobacteria bacterium]|jgi:DNA-binding CsgD family transcriptional regulator|nr:LuxR C-terminal-related transcriptional regulator [Gammaproteobacteria bacterium]